ncbi:MAG: type II toxin-antitoxin system RelE/ParE family toxin [Rhodoferax sp.]|nr:type II toxin-antitoxin system RelE/ParE family toxin [Rhodoferax sp.]MCF8208882.1 type II toxin-antitoxin system RelE/ParE family toxin [Rhodoferax sp.]
MADCVVIASPSFVRFAKKMHAKDKLVLDQAVKDVVANPQCGEEKRGDLSGVFVHKFKLNNQAALLAYELIPDKLKPTTVILLAVGSHENFYEQLKRNERTCR